MAATGGPAGDDLFVYGTLLPGHLRWPMIRQAVVAVVDAEVRGVLYDTGSGYPAARFAPGATTVVTGAVLTLAAGALEVIDRIEGPGYRRVRVTTTAGGAAVSYEWIGPLEGLVAMARPWGLEDEAGG
jgi:gamma-glutamylcyclotransferase (GGCT)/AIG2-like uncharacterized protein YtfP